MNTRNLILILAFNLCLYISQSQELAPKWPLFHLEFEELDSVEFRYNYDYEHFLDTVTNISQNQHRLFQKLETYQLEKNNIDFMTKIDGGWSVKMINGSLREMKPNEWSDAYEYNFVHYHSDFDIAVFRIQYGEGSGFVLLHRRTGQVQNTIGPPIFSPDGKYFMSIYSDIIAGYSENGFQLFKKSGRFWNEEIRYDSPLGPTRINWRSNKELICEAYYESFSQEPNVYKYYKVLLVDN